MKKKFSFVNQFFAICISALILSCNNSSESGAKGSTDPDSVGEKPSSTEASFAPFIMMLIKHRVKDYTMWKEAFEEHVSVRQSHQLTDMDLARSVEDPNTVLIAEKVADLQKAKDFSSSTNLREVMTKAGVISKPEISYFNVIRRDESKIDTKDRVMVIHRVRDFEAWVKVYDQEGQAKRSEEGMLDRIMARGIEDPNLVLLSFAVTDLGKARAAITSESKKNLMISAGVEGVPVIEFYKSDN